ncbi:S8 family serine peptidase [Bacillus timonensis]|uniref:S8 family serine peptidase n=1 Tax=Bacillus timonensis TaxID=1033734 RepID=UPI00028A252A|nr:S8 family serine peptidase [Bacillus timonensis]
MRKLVVVLFAFLLVIPTFLHEKKTVSAAGTGLAVIDPAIETVWDKVNSLQVIVTFNGDGAPKENQLNLLKVLGINVGVSMRTLPIAGIVATKDQIEQLAQSNEVHSIYFNRKLEYFNETSTDITGVDRVRADEHIRLANGDEPLTGKGVGVVVNDSGVDGTHGDHLFGKNLVQNVLGSVNLANLVPGLLPITYLENVPNTDTNSGHGTHVAGTVGGTGAMSDGKYEGVAPGADLIGYGSGATLFILDAISGFDYAIKNKEKYNIRVITNSWGSSGDFDPTDPINIASKTAYNAGITVLFAAGNEGPSENTHNPYAKAPWVISVAAGDSKVNLADFSSRGTNGAGGTFTLDGKEWTWKDAPTITAPGVDIVSTRAIAPVSSLAALQDVQTLKPSHVPFYTIMSGTSMATPHVAGIVALLLEANPELTPDDIKQIIQDTATPMPGYEEWEVGAGYVDAYAAVTKAIDMR